jgi:hypothetical protein
MHPQQPQQPDKKAYHRPRLLTYGTIRELTRTINNGMGVVDNNFGPPFANFKTQ